MAKNRIVRYAEFGEVAYVVDCFLLLAHFGNLLQ